MPVRTIQTPIAGFTATNMTKFSDNPDMLQYIAYGSAAPNFVFRVLDVDPTASAPVVAYKANIITTTVGVTLLTMQTFGSKVVALYMRTANIYYIVFAMSESDPNVWISSAEKTLFTGAPADIGVISYMSFVKTSSYVMLNIMGAIATNSRTISLGADDVLTLGNPSQFGGDYFCVVAETSPIRMNGFNGWRVMSDTPTMLYRMGVDTAGTQIKLTTIDTTKPVNTGVRQYGNIDQFTSLNGVTVATLKTTPNYFDVSSNRIVHTTDGTNAFNWIDFATPFDYIQGGTYSPLTSVTPFTAGITNSAVLARYIGFDRDNYWLFWAENSVNAPVFKYLKVINSGVALSPGGFRLREILTPIPAGNAVMQINGVPDVMDKIREDRFVIMYRNGTEIVVAYLIRAE